MKDLTKNPVDALRKNTTPAEKILWYYLRAKRFNGYKFRRQHLIHPYIVDFVCLEKKLIIELDGRQHTSQQTYDQTRAIFLESKGYRILRFWNNELLQERNTTLEMILKELKH